MFGHAWWDRRRLRPLVLVIAVCAVVGLLTAPAAGRPGENDQRQADREVAKAAAALENATMRARQAGASYTNASRRLPAAQIAASEAAGRVAAAQVVAGAAQREVQAVDLQLAAVQAELDRSRTHVDDARDKLRDFVRAGYQSQSFAAMPFLTDASEVEGVLDRIGYVDLMVDAQKRALDGVVAARQVSAERHAEVAAVKKRAEAARKRAASALAGAEDQQRAAQAAKVQVAVLVTQRQKALAVAQQERSSSERLYNEALAESRRIAAALRDAAKRGNRPPPTAERGGPLRMPVSGWKSSDFGMRYDPYYNRWQLHAGTDFAAPGGAAIRAAASGVVVRAGWNGGYGRYTCIYHYNVSRGRGLSTCYAHQSSQAVGVGQRVGRGQVIGRVGTTGASTGNHLHFEVRLDGEPVNPLRWL